MQIMAQTAVDQRPLKASDALSLPNVDVDIDGGTFKSVMRQVAGAVSVITTADGQQWAGLTATSLTALSAEPPTILICVNRAASAWPVLEKAGRFAVNLLSAEQKEIADRFAGRGGERGEQRFAGEIWEQLATGAPVLSNALASLDCITEEVINRHSHAIVIGRVKAIGSSSAPGALLYWRGAYGQVEDKLQHGAGI
jgi:flavin reductase (DIM6/NTAB) family NADH-FMN oxidoreductase RutF